MRLIDVDKLKNYWKSWDMNRNDNDVTTIGAARTGFEWLINAMPIIDAEPRKRGKWFYDEDGWWHCSECLAIYPDGITDEINYCPNCGAKMDEEVSP